MYTRVKMDGLRERRWWVSDNSWRRARLPSGQISHIGQVAAGDNFFFVSHSFPRIQSSPVHIIAYDTRASQKSSIVLFTHADRRKKEEKEKEARIDFFGGGASKKNQKKANCCELVLSSASLTFRSDPFSHLVSHCHFSLVRGLSSPFLLLSQQRQNLINARVPL
jgi:hypothetical protein